jgi:hypothetical protein
MSSLCESFLKPLGAINCVPLLYNSVKVYIQFTPSPYHAVSFLFLCFCQSPVLDHKVSEGRESVMVFSFHKNVSCLRVKTLFCLLLYVQDPVVPDIWWTLSKNNKFFSQWINGFILFLSLYIIKSYQIELIPIVIMPLLSYGEKEHISQW